MDLREQLCYSDAYARTVEARVASVDRHAGPAREHDPASLSEEDRPRGPRRRLDGIGLGAALIDRNAGDDRQRCGDRPAGPPSYPLRRAS